jgi:SAM-dependent methyltransferase
MTTNPGTASTQRDLWGAKAKDFAEIQERMCEPLYRAAFAKISLCKGMSLLDVGCGAGGAASIAASLGATVAGIDATPEFVAIAQARVPTGDFQSGEMELLPYADRSFDGVVGFNSFQYAAAPVRALAQAKRVARHGAHVIIATWGKPEDCDMAVHLTAIGKLLPPPPPGAPGPFALSKDGALAALASEAGLEPLSVEDVDCPFAYPDQATALRGMLSAGPLIRAIRLAGEERVHQATLDVLTAFSTSSGGYRLENKFRFLTARPRAASV